ncbi:MAG: four helix bundle protein [Bacteroidota bacterium]
MGKIEVFEDLEIWQSARELSNRIFLLSKNEPFKNDFKFRNQILGSSGSVMDNIAEGFERGGNKEFNQFLSIAKGSAGETRSQLYRVLDRKYISQKEFEDLYNAYLNLSKKIGKLMTYLRQSELKGPKYKTPTLDTNEP